jgi:hypothetical protein
LRKNQANALSISAGVWAQASQERFAEITSGSRSESLGEEELRSN